MRNFFKKLGEIKYPHEACGKYETEYQGRFSLLDPGGDEISCSLFYCNRCKIHFLRCYHDSFIGDDNFTSELELNAGEVETIREGLEKCGNPADKYCDCEYHRRFCEIVKRLPADPSQA